MKIRKIAAFALALAAVLAWLILPASADGGASLALSCTTGKPGDIVTLTLSVSELGDVTDGDIVVTFDDEKLEYVGREITGLIREAEGGLSVWAPRVTYSFMMESAGAAADSDGVLARYRFRVKETGVCAFTCSVGNWVGDRAPDGFTYRVDMTLRVPALTLEAVQTGPQVLLTVSGDCLTGLAACDAIIAYDTSLLAFRDAETASLDALIAGFETEKKGSLYFGVAGEDALTTDKAVLAIYTFDAIGTGDAVFTLKIGFWEGTDVPADTSCTIPVTGSEPASGEPVTQPETPTQPPLKKGDVDGDGRVTARDARLTLRASARLEIFTPAQTAAALVTGGDKVTARDARKILRVSARLESFD